MNAIDWVRTRRVANLLVEAEYVALGMDPPNPALLRATKRRTLLLPWSPRARRMSVNDFRWRCRYEGFPFGVDVNGAVMHARDGLWYGIPCETQMCGGVTALVLRRNAIERLLPPLSDVPAIYEPAEVDVAGATPTRYARDGGGAEDERCILHVLNHPIGHIPSRIRTLAKLWAGEAHPVQDREAH